MKPLRAVVTLAILLAAIDSPVLLGTSAVREARTPPVREGAASGFDLEVLDPFPAFGPPARL